MQATNEAVCKGTAGVQDGWRIGSHPWIESVHPITRIIVYRPGNASYGLKQAALSFAVLPGSTGVLICCDKNQGRRAPTWTD